MLKLNLASRLTIVNRLINKVPTDDLQAWLDNMHEAQPLTSNDVPLSPPPPRYRWYAM